MTVIYGVGNVVREETCNLNRLILSASTQPIEITTQQGGGLWVNMMWEPRVLFSVVVCTVSYI